MLKDMIEPFKKAVEKNKSVILDNYILRDGLYIKLDRKKPISQIDESKYLVVDVKKEIPPEKLDIYNWVKERDYCSQILNTNKAIDLPAKKILSSNYLSYFIQKDRLPKIGSEKKMLSMEILKNLTERYYDRLKNAESYFKELVPGDMKFKVDKKNDGLEEFLQAYYYEEISHIRNDSRKQDI